MMASAGDGEQLVGRIRKIYDAISKLPSLEPSDEVNRLFTRLVLTCTPPTPLDVTRLSADDQEMRRRLIRLCGAAEGLLERHYSALLASHHAAAPLDHVAIFPYYDNYLRLALLEHTLLGKHSARPPSRVAFVGSGPLPLTSIVLARHHLPSAVFHNYDLDPDANARALRLVAGHPDLSSRMFFHTADVREVTGALRDYDAVFLAALVGVGAAEKAEVLKHLARHMAPGALLVARSAHGARAFLYPVVDPGGLRCFELLDVFHPGNEVINSVLIARKLQGCGGGYPALDQPPAAHGRHAALPCKCSRMQSLNPRRHGSKMEELTTL